MRLFVSVRPPVEAVAHLRAALPGWPGPPDRWHVTLAFLGEVPVAEPVAQQLRAALQDRPPFELALAGSGEFGRGGPVWVGVAGEVDRLAELAARTATAVREAGVELERRRYRPHLTVGKRGRPDPALLAGYRGPAWPVREVELVRSDLGRTVVHTVLERFPLG